MNAFQTAELFFGLEIAPAITAGMETGNMDMEAVCKKIAELLQSTWEQSRERHSRADDMWYIEEENTYGVTLTPQAFDVTLSSNPLHRR